MPTDIGKFAVGLKGFPTPNNPADADAYLLFYFPDKQWSQYVLGALSVLGVGYNWYKSGDLDVDEAAEAFRVIVQDAPYNMKTCSNPDGGKIIRVAPSGHVQQLSDANTWEDTTGDYAIPPVPAREGDDPDIICLAAKNCANVLDQLYEAVSEAFAAGLSEAAAGVALIEAISLIVGVEFAPITFAIVSVSAAIFAAFYEIVGFITADLWTEDFTNTITCYLQDCATAVDGVVTFDWDCFNGKLAAQVNIFDLSFTQLRLFGQIQYLLLMCGGVDALNLAGATTGITDDTCDFCEPRWCYDVDLTLDPWVLEIHTQSGWSAPFGHWESGVGYVADTIFNTGGNSATLLEVQLLPPPDANYTIVFAYFTWVAGVNPQPAYLGFDTDFSYSGTVPDGDNIIEYDGDATNPTSFDLQLNPAFGVGAVGGSAVLYRITMQGRGENPFGETNC